MKRHLNTLFVMTQDSYLSKDGETVVVKFEDKVLVKIPIHTLGSIVCFGRVSHSPSVLGLCAENGVAISFLTEYGRFIAKLQGPVSGNVLLRKAQYRLSDDVNSSILVAKGVLTGKISNSRTVLKRMLRDHPEKSGSDVIEAAADKLTSSLRRLQSAASLDEIRGIEGDSAHNYFTVFDNLITSQKGEFRFKGRSRRPSMDNVNCLLSFLYTMVMHDIRSGLEIVGLDPAVGFLHRDRPGRPGLALDILEEFRPMLADRLTLTMINLSQVQGKGFKKDASGAVLMDEETRKTVLTTYQKRKQEEIVHPFLNEKVTIGLLFHVQALLLARFLRGDIDGYPPFIWK
ncbi:MAG: type I-C CRISPR-associated endonuclease Cas1 [Nitrospirae bacterium]|nr:type I-C CRISPR-associated endonuclease Cas1 [Nitrospirota bacterium]